MGPLSLRDTLTPAAGMDWEWASGQDPESRLLAGLRHLDPEAPDPCLPPEVVAALASLTACEKVALWGYCRGLTYGEIQDTYGMDRKNAYRAKQNAVRKLKIALGVTDG